MEIIYRGTPPVDKLYEGACTSCRTKVEYRRDEAKESPDQRDNGATYIDCPVCQGIIWGREKTPAVPEEGGM